MAGIALPGNVKAFLGEGLYCKHEEALCSMRRLKASQHVNRDVVLLDT